MGGAGPATYNCLNPILNRNRPALLQKTPEGEPSARLGIPGHFKTQGAPSFTRHRRVDIRPTLERYPTLIGISDIPDIQLKYGYGYVKIVDRNFHQQRAL
jgi:hypothetical protein